ncbi:MAG: hypothetical protein CMI63_10695 [Parvularcula sp.]|nr:hypothetical protein [Parvularcula sp.]
MSATVAVRNGSVYLSASVVETYFRGIEAVIVLIRDGAVSILPVYQMAAGGCLLKMRNAAGDRVASAPDVFEANDLLSWQAQDLPASWSSEQGALIVPLPANPDF